MENKKIAHEDIMKFLDGCYAKSLAGIPLVGPSVADMANDYLQRYSKKEDAIKAMLKIKLSNALPPDFSQGLVDLLPCLLQYQQISAARYMCRCV